MYDTPPDAPVAAAMIPNSSCRICVFNNKLVSFSKIKRSIINYLNLFCIAEIWMKQRPILVKEISLIPNRVSQIEILALMRFLLAS